MNAKMELFERIKYLDFATNLPSLIDIGIIPNEQNGAANLLRKGLGIVAFNILEDFIKMRTEEALDYISNSGIVFENLPDKLQDASILEALQSLFFRAKIERKEGKNWKKLIQDESLKIHSTQNLPYTLSRFSLISSASNVTEEDIPKLLNAFSIPGGWATLESISNSIYGGVPDIRQSYINASSRRHNAAHAVSFSSEYLWLTQMKNEIISIAVSIDIALTAMCRKFYKNLDKKICQKNLENELNYRFLEDGSKGYKEFKSMNGRTKKIWPNLNGAIASIKPKLVHNSEFLIILNSSKRIIDWHS